MGLALLCTIMNLGCYTWTRQDMSIPDIVASRPDYMRVWTVGDTAPVVIGRIAISHDSLTALIEGSAPPGHPLLTFQVPVSSIVRVERFQYNHRRSLAMAAIPVLLPAYALFLVVF